VAVAHRGSGRPNSGDWSFAPDVANKVPRTAASQSSGAESLDRTWTVRSASWSWQVMMPPMTPHLEPSRRVASDAKPHGARKFFSGPASPPVRVRVGVRETGGPLSLLAARYLEKKTRQFFDFFCAPPSCPGSPEADQTIDHTRPR